MSDFLLLKPTSINREVRDSLFGDTPLGRLVQAKAGVSLAEPWKSFQTARTLADSGQQDEARKTLHQILGRPDIDSRTRLQTWHALRELAEEPPAATGKELMGVVVEVGMKKGLDIVCAYADHRARYFNFAGTACLWERPDDSLDGMIDELLVAGKAVVDAIAPWKQARPPEPGKGMVRINLLTPSGLHLGQGSQDALKKDPLGGPILTSAFTLMDKLVETAKKKREAES